MAIGHLFTYLLIKTINIIVSIASMLGKRSFDASSVTREMKNVKLNSKDLLLELIAVELRPATNIVDQLHHNGYNRNFELVGDRLRCFQDHRCCAIRDFNVDEIHRLEDESGALTGFTLYAIRERLTGNKGLFIIPSSDKSPTVLH